MIIQIIDPNNNYDLQEIEFYELLSMYNLTLLYFYPKDDTPWCSIEAKDFIEYTWRFNDLWVQIVWVSKDNLQSHLKFMKKINIKFKLISDENLKLHTEFWTWWEKKMYWKTYMWTIRSSFLIDKQSKIIKSWLNVNSKWHVEQIYNEIELLINN